MSRGPLHTILYAEHDVHMRVLVKMALEVIGRFEVLDCDSGAAAVAVGAACHPDLILLDASMPEADGIATLERLRLCPHLERTPVIFVTAHTAGWDVEPFLEAGAIGLIAAPLEPMRVTEQLRRLWTRAPAPPTGSVMLS
ncbi:MAG TPA: hypothetical protein DCW29_04290 [Janthinobacterium sp.]|nr:hypothetical protein [Janthinobacterium sp.]